MKVTAVFSQSLRSIWNNKVRSSLTILGIVIGIAAVISLVGLGKGLQASVEGQLSKLNPTAMTINSKDPNRPQAQRVHGEETVNFSSATENLSEADYQAIAKVKNITAASPELQTQTSVALSEKAAVLSAYQIVGVDTPYLKLKDIKVVAGNNLTAKQVSDGESVVLIGKKAASELFPKDATYVGKVIYIRDQPFTIIGVVDQDPSKVNTSTERGDVSTTIYTGYKRWLTLGNRPKLATIVASVNDKANVQTAADNIKALLLGAHKIADGSKADFDVITSKELLKTIEGVTIGFTATLTGIAAISLVVGGIGIMNIMLVTVTERTREIGLRRAVGAKTRHILMQFLTESVLLTLIGGGLGLLVGVSFSSKISTILSFAPGQHGPQAAQGAGVTAIVDAQTIILAVAVSAAIGIIFGLFPAIKAAKLDPVDALRYE
jgi:putative ABC transport system permease protein